MACSRRIGALPLGLSLGVLVVGCAAMPGSGFLVNPAGFVAGFWHGLICWITFILSLFSGRVRMYEVINAGKLYDLGFLLGVSAVSWALPVLCWCRRQWPMLKGQDEAPDELERMLRASIESWARQAGYTGKESEAVTRRIQHKLAGELRDLRKRT